VPGNFNGDELYFIHPYLLNPVTGDQKEILGYEVDISWLSSSAGRGSSKVDATVILTQKATRV
jgi:hypothetical protein